MLTESSADPVGRAPRLVAESPAMQRVLADVRRVAHNAAPVLIEGETGTGKELVARLIHAQSPRRRRGFVSHNCGATPDTLIESELFGHVRGAFTGAVRDRGGLFDLAEGGTLFLDEIGDISPLMQVKLLRVLQEREYRRVGDARPRRADVRLIAATNKSLEREVDAGRFRADLYYRLHVLTIELRPLRERPADVRALLHHFAGRFAAEDDKQPVRFSEAARRALERYSWPGNVRELENELRRLTALCGGEEVRVDHLSRRVRSALLEATGPRPADDGLRAQVMRLERGLIAEALIRAGGNKSRTARELGLSRQGLAKKMRRYGMRWLGREDSERVESVAAPESRDTG